MTLLSKHENFIKNAIKQETKTLGLGISVDSLIIAGNLSRLKLLRKLEKLPIEKTIKKALIKNTYLALKRTSYIDSATNIEKDNTSRLIRLRQTKALVAAKDLSYENVLKLFVLINSMSSQDQISRGLFLSIANKEIKWPIGLSSNFFTTFDQQGLDSVPIKQLKLGLSVLASNSIDEKLMLCYLAYDVNNTKTLTTEAVCDLLSTLEETLDYRSKFVKNNLREFSKSLGKYNPLSIEMNEFIACVNNDPACQSLIKIIIAIESFEVISSTDMKIANITLDGDYSNTHSPIMTSSINTPKSDISYEGPNFDELDSKLNNLAKTYNDLIEKEPLLIQFDVMDSDRDSIL